LLFLLGETLLEFNENDEKCEEDWNVTKSKFSFFSQVTSNDIEHDSAKIEAIRMNLNNETYNLDNEGNDEPNDYYFGGYSHIGIHETMLRDAARTNAYADALLKNKDFVKDKVVLDVGCGTGILCLLAAKAGAKKVIGVDMSSIIERSKKVISNNGYNDIITLVRGKLEEVKLPLDEGEKVDIIVSEWMGYGLYFENMLPAVMFAREKYLRTNNVDDSRQEELSINHLSAAREGIIMPSDAILFVEAITCDSLIEDRVGWWEDVYGFDMTEMVDLLTAEAQVEVTSPKSIISNRAQVHCLDIRRAVDKDLDFVAPFTMVSK
jgi:protein arginine N-methyltransferase 1